LEIGEMEGYSANQVRVRDQTTPAPHISDAALELTASSGIARGIMPFNVVKPV